MFTDRVHIGVCLRDGDAWLEAFQDDQPVKIVIHLVGSQHERHNDLPVQPIGLSGRLNSDDRVDIAVQVDLFANDVGVAGKISLPEFVGDDGHMVFAWHTFFGQKVASHERPVADNLIEKTWGQIVARNKFRFLADGQVERATTDNSQRLKDRAFALPIQVIACRDDVPVAVHSGPDHHQLFGMRIGEIRDQRGVEDAVDRGIRSNADSECQQRYQSEAGILA
jgi:hypothetical protein